MNARDAERLLAAADPVATERLDGLDFEAMEADLLADIEGGRAALEVEPAPRPHVRRPLVLALGTAALAAALALVFLVFGDGNSGRPARAYGAELIRFAESTPLLLLEGPGWRVQEVNEYKTREGNEGQMEFVTGKAVPWGSIRVTGNDEEGQYQEGLEPAAVRQRLVHLNWRELSQQNLATAIEYERGRIHPHGRHFVRLPVTDTTAFVDTHAEIFVNQGGPGDREMLALWSEDGFLLEMTAAVPDLAGMEERLDWVTKVDSQTWLEAMPPKVVKAADIRATERRMLQGVPVPKTFSLGRIPEEGLTVSHDQLAGKVTGVVACLWFRQWGEAVRSGDAAAKAEAEKALLSSPSWPVLHREYHGNYRGDIYKFALAMPQGYWEWHGHHRDLLAHAEGLGCARYGLPLVPAKMKRQREDGVPPPPD
ncbi:MAG: hypothetical protein BGO11_16430 [Solirubrobacterales bacterium 70-9]|nr:MAG: hypothetical protein BGO11_16430 [Solirubrobacterales bacterium 70-9]